MDHLLWLVVFGFGAVIGSFLNVCIYRLPEKQSLISPSSHCPICGKVLGFFDLIPVFSYFILRGKCRYCGRSVSIQYLLVELATGILFVLAVVKYGFTCSALRAAVLFVLVVPAAIIDWRHRIIPDKLNMAAFILAVPLLFESKEVLHSGLLGFLCGGGLLLLIAVLSRGGMGGGDIKLAAVLGLLLGWPLLPVALFLAFAAGSVFGIIMLLYKQAHLKEPVPFGPFLAFGAVCAALFGDLIVVWYLAFLN